jgi:glycogen debranching enzyme
VFLKTTAKNPPATPDIGRPTRIDARTFGIDIAHLERTLASLGRVDRIEDLGKNGPLSASNGADSLFNCLFGRDSIRMAMDLQQRFPAVARSTILALAEHQGVTTNARSEEEPGRIIHEHRAPTDALYEELTKTWSFPYYGAVDSTPNFINLIATYVREHGPAILDERFVDRAGKEATIRDAVARATQWILGRMDGPGDGYLVDYVYVRRMTPESIPNQVWEDSGDSYYDERGVLADPTRPYAPVAVQAYAYDALLAAADLLDERTGQVAAGALRERAKELRKSVLQDFWQPDMQFFAQALAYDAPGKKGRPFRVATSSPGHLLESGMLYGKDVVRVGGKRIRLAHMRNMLVRRLMQEDMLGAEGIRTKSTTAPRFRAGSYHNGSVWPMDNAVIAHGLRRHGYVQQAREIEDRILRACGTIGGYPEFFRGDIDGEIRVNTEIVDALVDGRPNRLEQPPQAEQGWTATAIWSILARRGLV